MKCLPSNKLPFAHGNILHDWHAEVIAIRAFNRYLLHQCILISTPPYATSDFLRQRSPEDCSDHEGHPFTIRDDVTIHMYCSEAPCGDASMELTMAAQEDATPWTSAPPTLISPSSSANIPSTVEEIETSALRGRSNFSLLGVVRAKPSRPDAPPTLSKSCTDKLTLKQASSLLSSTTSLLISPGNAYLKTLVLPSSQFVPVACERAFSLSGRLKALNQKQVEKWKGGYQFRPFEVEPTNREFAWSRRAVSSFEKSVSSNLSAVWTPNWQETLIGGVLQGRKQLDPRGASKICRRAMWMEAVKVTGLLSGVVVREALRKRTYGDMKETEALEKRKSIKQDVRKALKGWARNTGDDDFDLKDLPGT
ncbi:tRNA-specific adenosine deaminase [Clathrospora elynae]|uniref:tRNA-specific adenosine deaminase n=1 Tax=Clathrospora elynae TaxID=706981 RepID=A0A6A5S5W9_9PLEO|nr:tRNA-specific adenosine deaminase [Clathrospora elynae]